MFAGIPRALRSQLKFIILLREPLSRDLSMYNHIRGIKAHWGFCPERESTRYGGNAYRQFLDEGLRCINAGAGRGGGGRGCSDCILMFAQLGHYARHLKEWFSYFDRRQFFILHNDALNTEKKGREKVAEALRGLGSFLEVKSHGGEAGWQQSMQKGYRREHTSRGYRGSHVSRIEHLPPEQCRAAAAVFDKWNQELYALLAATRQQAPPGEPPFEEFQDPCGRATGLPEVEVVL